MFSICSVSFLFMFGVIKFYWISFFFRPVGMNYMHTYSILATKGIPYIDINIQYIQYIHKYIHAYRIYI